MKVFSTGFVIGASLAGSFNQTLGAAQSKLSTLGDEIKKLKSQKAKVDTFNALSKDLGDAKASFKTSFQNLKELKEKHLSAAGAAEELRQKLARAESRVGILAHQYRKAKQPSKDLENKFIQATRAAAVLKTELKAADQQTKEFKKAVSTAAQKSEKLKSSLVKKAHALNEARRALKQAGISTKSLDSQYSRLGQSIDKTRSKQERLEKVMARKSGAGKRLAELRGEVVALGAAIYAAARTFTGLTAFEDAEVRLSTVANTNNLGRSLAESRRHALAYTRKNLSTETEILDIEYALNSAGLDASASRMGTEVVSKVAKITAGTAEGVGEVVATVFNNLGGQLSGGVSERLGRIGELLTKTQFKFQIRNFDQLGESMKMATPAFQAYNVEISQGLTLLGALNSAGLQGTMAGTAISASFRQMSKASEEFGFEIARNEKGQLDFIQTLENMSEAIGGFDAMDQDTLDRMQKAFGDEGQRAVVLLGKKLAGLRDAQKDVEEGSKGLVDESYQRFLRSMSGQIQIFRNNVRTLGMAFVAGLAPGINTVLKPLTTLAGWTGLFLEKFPQVSKFIVGAVAGFAALKIGIMAVTAAQWLWNAAQAANPIGAVVALIGGAAALIFHYWEPISGFFKRLWREVSETFKEGVRWVKELWEESLVGKMISGGLDVAGKIGDFFGVGKDEKAGPDGAGVGGAMNKGVSRLEDVAAHATDKKIVNAGQQVNNNFAPTVNIPPGADTAAVKAQVNQGLMESENRFRQMLEQVQANDQRLAFEG